MVRLIVAVPEPQIQEQIVAGRGGHFSKGHLHDRCDGDFVQGETRVHKRIWFLTSRWRCGTLAEAQATTRVDVPTATQGECKFHEL